MTERMKLYYNNVEIYQDVSICYCVHEMFAEKTADSLTIRFNDVSNMWSNWNPEEGDQIRLQYQYADTGVMFVHSVNAVNGVFTIRALSIPPAGKEKKSRSWEGLSFLRLISQIASENKLSYKCYGITDQIYKYISQEDETDFAFLQRICEYEGCSYLIFNKTIVVYSEKYIENGEASVLIVGDNGVFSYDRTGKAYAACTVTNGKITGTFETQSSGSMLNAFAPATSNGEAVRFASGILRANNKKVLSGRITKSLHTQFSPASLINLKTAKASIWDKKVFVTRLRHDYLMNSTDIYFRGILEGY